MEARIVRATAMYPNAVFLQWDITRDVTEEGDVIVDVERSGSTEGPWEPVSSGLLNAYSTLDDRFDRPIAEGDELREDPNLFSLSREIYYRVNAYISDNSTISAVSAPTPIEPELDERNRLLKRKLVRDFLIACKLQGFAIAILKRKRWGIRCPSCWDPVNRQGMYEHCDVCFGTTFKGGYWAAVRTRGRRATAPAQETLDSQNTTNVRFSRIWVPDMPLVEPDDLIIDVRRDDRFVIRMSVPTEIRGIAVHQTATVSLLARDAIEYKVPL